MQAYKSHLKVSSGPTCAQREALIFLMRGFNKQVSLKAAALRHESHSSPRAPFVRGSEFSFCFVCGAVSGAQAPVWSPLIIKITCNPTQFVMREGEACSWLRLGMCQPWPFLPGCFPHSFLPQFEAYAFTHTASASRYLPVKGFRPFRLSSQTQARCLDFMLKGTNREQARESSNSARRSHFRWYCECLRKAVDARGCSRLPIELSASSSN